MKRSIRHKDAVFWCHLGKIETLSVGGPYFGWPSQLKKEHELKRKLLHKAGNHRLEINTYRFSQPMAVMVADEHPIIDHGLEVLFVHINRKQNGILLLVSQHGHPEVIRIKVVHVRN